MLIVRSGSRFACVPANLYCFSGLFGGLQDLGLNMYDVRKKCDKSEDKDGPVRFLSPIWDPTRAHHQLCYKEMGWMETYLNKPEVKKRTFT
jgi:cathepsin A (carboxypeptidase C)